MYKLKKEKKATPKDVLKNYDALMIAKRLEKVTGINVFQKSRLRDNVYIRSVFNHILKEFFDWNLTRIARLYEANGYKQYDHATVWHSINMFDLYVKYEPKLMNLFEQVGIKINEEGSLRILIQQKIKRLTTDELKKTNKFIENFYSQN